MSSPGPLYFPGVLYIADALDHSARMLDIIAVRRLK